MYPRVHHWPVDAHFSGKRRSKIGWLSQVKGIHIDEARTQRGLPLGPHQLARRCFLEVLGSVLLDAHQLGLGVSFKGAVYVLEELLLQFRLGALFLEVVDFNSLVDGVAAPARLIAGI